MTSLIVAEEDRPQVSKAEQNETITKPPFSATFRKTSSGTFLVSLHKAKAEECEKMIGARDTSRAANIVPTDT